MEGCLGSRAVVETAGADGSAGHSRILGMKLQHRCARLVLQHNGGLRGTVCYPHHVAVSSAVQEKEFDVLRELSPGGILRKAAREIHVAGATHRFANGPLFRGPNEHSDGGTYAHDGANAARDFLNVDARICRRNCHGTSCLNWSNSERPCPCWICNQTRSQRKAPAVSGSAEASGELKGSGTPESPSGKTPPNHRACCWDSSSSQRPNLSAPVRRVRVGRRGLPAAGPDRQSTTGQLLPRCPSQGDAQRDT